MGRVFVVVASLLLILALLAAGVTAWVHVCFNRPGPLAADTRLVVPRGSGIDAIAGQLERAGVLDDPAVFRLGTRLLGAEKKLRAGEYLFPARSSLQGVLSILRDGKTVVRRLTIPEGLTSAEILRELRDAEGLEGELALVPEGTLLPETYHYSWGDSRELMVVRMSAAMEDVLARLWEERARDLPLKTPREALILASVVEKETGVKGERPRVAGVFMNRLRKQMRLQSDPTVAYGLNGGRGALDRALTRADLQTDHAYNTYRIDGLPPGPICNPGRAALAAVMKPLATDELFFVADGNGGHVFAKTLAEHNRNVERWRKARRDR